MAQPWTDSETRFADYLTVRGYQPERDVDWRSRFGVDTPKDPDFLVSRAGEDLAICEVKEFTDTPLDRRLADAHYATSSSAELHASVSDAVRDAAREQLRPFADIGLPLVVVLANPHGKMVALAPGTMPMSLFGITETVFIDVGPGAPPPANAQLILGGRGALIDERPAFRAQHPHPYLSAIVVLHARREADDYLDMLLAQQRRTRPPHSHQDNLDNGADVLEAFAEADQAGLVPSGEYEWVSVFDLSAHPLFRGTPLPSHAFDGVRDLRFDLASNGTFVQLGAAR
jgi:hypothetical protein